MRHELPLSFTCALEASLGLFACLWLAACSSTVDVSQSSAETTGKPTNQRDGAVTGAPGDSGNAVVTPEAAVPAPVCSVDAATPGVGTIAPSNDSGNPTCPAGWFLNSGSVCDFFTLKCTPHGDDRCYKICGTSDDCSDPCAPACGTLTYYAGGDTGRQVPVCLPGIAKSYPAKCIPGIKACFKACLETEDLPGCAATCQNQAGFCAESVCPLLDECVQRCPDPSGGGCCVDEYAACFGPS